MSEYNAYVAWAFIHAPKALTNGKIQENPDIVALMNQRIKNGAECFAAWAVGHGGSVVENNNIEGMVQVPAYYLDELVSIQQKAMIAAGTKTNVGVGMEMWEAAMALAEGVADSKQVNLYSDTTPKALSELTKSNGINYQKFPRWQRHPSSQTAQAKHVIQQEAHRPVGRPRKYFGTVGKLHGIAQAQEKKDNDQKESQLAGPQGRVAQALELIQSQLPALIEMKDMQPDLYKAILGLTQAVIEYSHVQSGK